MKSSKQNSTLFELVQLFISISIPVTIGVYTILENNRELSIATRNRQQDLALNNLRKQNFILREFQKTLNKLIETYGIDFDENSSVSLVARFATLSALNHLDSNRRSFLIRLLYEAKLITYISDEYKPPVPLHSANLTDLNLFDESQRRVLHNISLTGAIMTRADFHEIHISGARFYDTILTNANFSWTWNTLSFHDNGVDLENNSSKLFFVKANLASASFSSATYENADFTFANMSNANLERFFCSNCWFDSTTMTEINLESAHIQNTLFMFVMFDHANLYRSNFGFYVDIYETKMNYANANHINLTKCNITQTELVGTIFDYSSIINSTFFKINMNNASMKYSKIIGTHFKQVDLSFSDWEQVQCEQCIFEETNFTETDLIGATFIDCDFRNSKLTEKQLIQIAYLENTTLSV